MSFISTIADNVSIYCIVLYLFAAASNNAIDSKRKADTWKRNRRALVSDCIQ